MSLSSDINDPNGYVWSSINDKGKYNLRQFCEAKTRELPNGNSAASYKADRMLVGMAMRYAMMKMFHPDYLANHPVSKAYERHTRKNFRDIVVAFDDEIEAFLYLALLDKEMRGGTNDDYWSNYKLDSQRGILRLDGIKDSRYSSAIYDIGNLVSTMDLHFGGSVINGPVKCLYCGTVQIPGKVWSCKKCGGALSYPTTNLSSVSLKQKAEFYYVSLLPTYAREIGGSDAPVAVLNNLFSIRTVTYSVVQPNHVLMAWGWWALFSEKECPPWKKATIYYSRQQSEVTFDLRAMNNMLGVNLDDFHRRLKERPVYDFDLEDREY